jgi:2-polyprenyl-3-methyl-5-hydroxy-6-metoxy-1,4-benzoquinol methylase
MTHAMEPPISPTLIDALRHITKRRRALRQRFDVARQMREIEETCIPSYLHGNLAAAGMAWARLFTASNLYRRFALAGPVLDFGAASGELAYLLPPDMPYEFVEADEAMARGLLNSDRRAKRHDLERLEPGRYAAVFALDSLEHNEDVGAILDRLLPSLRPDGVLILSGPTENWLYRLGRRIAGFQGGYHKTTIYQIERAVAEHMRPLERTTLPRGLPLFSISCWRSR